MYTAVSVTDSSWSSIFCSLTEDISVITLYSFYVVYKIGLNVPAAIKDFQIRVSSRKEVTNNTHKTPVLLSATLSTENAVLYNNLWNNREM